MAVVKRENEIRGERTNAVNKRRLVRSLGKRNVQSVSPCSTGQACEDVRLMRLIVVSHDERHLDPCCQQDLEAAHTDVVVSENDCSCRSGHRTASTRAGDDAAGCFCCCCISSSSC